jgi:hypothetical protein
VHSGSWATPQRHGGYAAPVLEVMSGKGPMTVADVAVGMGRGTLRKSVAHAMNALLACGAIEETGVESRFAERWWREVCTKALGTVRSRRVKSSARIGPEALVGVHPTVTGVQDAIPVLRYLCDRGLFDAGAA